jgi:hypothetical protein
MQSCNETYITDARFEVFTAVKIQVEVLRAVTLCNVAVEYTPHHSTLLHPEDGGSKFLQNVEILLQHYTISQQRRQFITALHSLL